jgi:hypothetical protein
MIGALARWSPRFRLAFFRYQQLLHGRPPWWCRGTRLRALATTPPSTFRRRRYPPRRAAGVAGDCRAWGVRRVPVRTLPQIQSGTRRSRTPAGWEGRPSSTAASLGRAPHFRHLWCSPAHSCESAGLGDDGPLLGEDGNGSGSRRWAHEVWWAPACVGRLKVGRVLLWETGGGRGWYRRSDPAPQT